MPDIRYHFIYLIAMFLMLGLGILIGSAFFGEDQVRRQTKAIEVLREQVNGAVQDGQEARSELAKDESALSGLRPALVRGKLSGRRVILIQTGDYSDATDSAAEALRDAGASLVATVKLPAIDWLTLTDKARADLSQNLAAAPAATPGDPPDPSPDNMQFMAALASVLVQGTQTNPKNAQNRGALEDAGLITVTGDLSSPTTEFVLVGGGKDDADTGTASEIDTPLLQQLQQVSNNGASIVGCEPFDAEVSYMRVYQSAGIPTVDCIDRPIGQLALPFALLGGGDADNYGLKPTASSQLPSSLNAQSVL